MILSESVIIKTFGNKKLKHYTALGYDVSNKEIRVRVEDLPKSINTIVLVQCDYCDNQHERKFVDYNRIVSKSISGKYACCRKCGIEKFKETFESLEKNPHPNKGKKIEKEKLNKILEKRKKTNLEKWGVEHVLQNAEVKQKFKETHLERFGVENYSMTDEFLEKQKNTSLEKWKVEHPSQNVDVKTKKELTNLKKWGVKSTLNIEKSNKNRLKVFNSEEFRSNYDITSHPNYIKYLGNSISKFKCDCNKEHHFEILYDNFKSRLENNIPLCTICYPINELVSIKENQVLEFIKSHYDGEVIQSYRDVLEIDIYLPDLKIGFEFNGLYYHSDKFKDKNYHLDKLNFFKEKNIRVINIWENDWSNRQEIIKSQILNILGKSNKIPARKCVIKEINNIKIARQFLDKNHIQGFVKSNIKLGLYHQNELVAIMLFDKSEGRKKMAQNEWNLSRFCNKINFSIIGGASKLLNFFIKNYSPKRIVSYSDKDWSLGHLYKNLGFSKVHETKPDYKYIVNNEMIHKSRFRKSVTGISESNIEIPKIWNCGKIKFEKKLN